MKRSEFLKSFAVLLAAPSIVKSIDAAPVVPKYSVDVWLKISPEMIADVDCMQWFIEHQCKYSKIDTSKHFVVNEVYMPEDVERNLRTIVISQ